MTYDKYVEQYESEGIPAESARELARLVTSGATLTIEDVNKVIRIKAEATPEPSLEKIYIFGPEDELISVDTRSESDGAYWEAFRSEQGPSSNNDQLIAVEKSLPGSNQQQQEIGGGDLSVNLGGGFGLLPHVAPPYDPQGLMYLLELDPVHARSVSAKVKDSVGRGYKLTPNRQFIPSRATPEDIAQYPDSAVDEVDIQREVELVKGYLRNINPITGFEGTLEKAAMDLEAIGYCAIEVVRDKQTNQVARLIHVPASRIRVLKDYTGFVELSHNGLERQTYYQVFGEKVRSKTRRDPITGEAARYDPELDGPIENAVQRLVDRTTGEPTRRKKNSANEIIFKVIHHPKTIYYGVPDIIPALGHLLANVEIRDYLLQFFKNNTIPRYAIIVKGIRLEEAVINSLQAYFSQEVQKSAHKTLFIPLPSIRGDASIEFKKLDADEKEGSFQETSKNNDTKIMVAEGLPPAILGVYGDTTIGTGSGMSQAEIYKDRIVDPRQKSWATILTDMLRLGWGIKYLDFEFNPLDLRDRESEMTILTGYADAGAMSINEVRQSADIGDPLPGGERASVAISSGLEFVDDFPKLVSGSIERMMRATSSDNSKAPGKPVNEDVNAKKGTNKEPRKKI